MGAPRTAREIAGIESDIPSMPVFELSKKEQEILSIVYVSAMEHDWNDWKELCEATEEELTALYKKLHGE
jgi:hypothetical protein